MRENGNTFCEILIPGGDVDNPNCEGDTGGETLTELYYNLAGVGYTFFRQIHKILINE